MEHHAFEHFVSNSTPEDFYSIDPGVALPQHPASLLLPLREVSTTGVPQSNQAALAIQTFKIPRALMNGVTEETGQGQVQFTIEPDAGTAGTGTSEANLGNTLAIQDFENAVASDAAAAAAEAENLPRVQGIRHVFFRLIAGNVSNKKRGRMDSGLQISKEHVAIERCQVRSMDQETQQVQVQLFSDREPELFQRPTSLQTFYKWQIVGTSQALKNMTLSKDALAALQAVAGAQIGSGAALASLTLTTGDGVLDQIEGGLQELVDKLVLEHESVTANASRWSLTPFGQENLCSMITLSNPRALQRMHVKATDPKQMNVFELVLTLQDKGFDMQLWPPSKQDAPQPFDIVRSSPKVWFAKEKTFSVPKVYLQALLLADTLLSRGHSQILHGQKKEYYEDLLDIKKKGSKKKNSAGPILAIVGDDGAVPLDEGDQLEALPPPPKRLRRGRLEVSGVAEQQPALADAPKENEQDEPPPLESVVEVEGGGADHNNADADDQDIPPELPAPLLPKPEKSQPDNRNRKQHEKTFRWGPSLVTFKPPNTWQATCCRMLSHKHEGGRNTRCTRTRTFRSQEQELQVLTELKHWLNCAKDYSTRIAHMQTFEMPDDSVTDAQLDAEKFASDYESDGETLPHDAAPEAASSSKPKLKPAAKGKIVKAAAKPKHKKEKQLKLDQPREKKKPMPKRRAGTKVSSTSSSSSSSSSSDSSSKPAASEAALLEISPFSTPSSVSDSE